MNDLRTIVKRNNERMILDNEIRYLRDSNEILRAELKAAKKEVARLEALIGDT